jgi:hypothetical protein
MGIGVLRPPLRYHHMGEKPLGCAVKQQNISAIKDFGSLDRFPP